MGQRPIEVVDRRQQLERELRRPALLRGRRLLDRPAAVVLKLGPRPLRQLEVLIRLLRLSGESRQVRLVYDNGFGLLRIPLRGSRCRVGANLRGVVLCRSRSRSTSGDRRGRLPGAKARPRGVRLVPRHYLPSSTTSASTTSSSSAPAPFVPDPSVDADSAASCWARWYIASDTLWNADCSASAFVLISAASSDVSTSRTSLIAASISSLEEASIVSLRSLSWRSDW